MIIVVVGIEHQSSPVEPKPLNLALAEMLTQSCRCGVATLAAHYHHLSRQVL